MGAPEAQTSDYRLQGRLRRRHQTTDYRGACGADIRLQTTDYRLQTLDFRHQTKEKSPYLFLPV